MPGPFVPAMRFAVKTGDTIAGFMGRRADRRYHARIYDMVSSKSRRWYRRQPGVHTMPRTIGYHLVKSAYGLWLPGDMRGHWSSAWDEQIGYFEPHHLHAADPIRERMARERMKHAPIRFTPTMIDAIACAVGGCAYDSDWRIVAAAIEATHMHLLLTYTDRDIDRTAKWLAQETTKRVHQNTSFAEPIWCEGKWREFIFDETHWENTRQYIERHNLRRALPARPWAWITP